MRGFCKDLFAGLGAAILSRTRAHGRRTGLFIGRVEHRQQE
jgi:hypothetical protein